MLSGGTGNDHLYGQEVDDWLWAVPTAPATTTFDRGYPVIAPRSAAAWPTTGQSSAVKAAEASSSLRSGLRLPARRHRPAVWGGLGACDIVIGSGAVNVLYGNGNDDLAWRYSRPAWRRFDVPQRRSTVTLISLQGVAILCCGDSDRAPAMIAISSMAARR